jgi:hypothetical protein
MTKTTIIKEAGRKAREVPARYTKRGVHIISQTTNRLGRMIWELEDGRHINVDPYTRLAMVFGG